MLKDGLKFAILLCHAVTLVTLKTKVLHGTRPREYFVFQRDIA